MSTITSCSVVVPVYNSQFTLPKLAERIFTTLPNIVDEFELILVNDGSKDQSWETIQNLCKAHAWVKGINLMRNYGQHNALLCGIRAAVYDTIVTMDDDLQHPPEEIPVLLAKLQEGYDVVYACPRKLPHSFWRNFFSQFTKKILSWVMGVKTVRNISAFRAFRTSLRTAFQEYKSPAVILDVLLSWGTSNFSSVVVDEAPRVVGKSNYSLYQLARQAFLILTGFSTIPLRFAIWLGFIFTVFGIGIFLYVIIVYFIAGSIPGFPFLASIISLFSGAQLFTLGIFGEYLGRVFDRSLDHPTYVIEKIIEGTKTK